MDTLSTEKRVEVLLREYDGLRLYVNTLMQAPNTIFPAGLSILLGTLALVGRTGGAVAYAVSMAVPLLLSWLVFNNINMNGAGLRIVELEHEINALAFPENRCGLKWYTNMICEGRFRFKGLVAISAVIWSIGLLIMLVASRLTWVAMRGSDLRPILGTLGTWHFVRVGIVIMPYLFFCAALGVWAVSEIACVARKKKITGSGALRT